MKPPMPYFGGKQTIARQIISLFPEHGHYVEPYCGSLSVLLAKSPSKMETVNDLHSAVMTFWRMLRDRPDELMRACALTPHSRAEYLHCRDSEPATDEIEIARRVWTVLAEGIGGADRGKQSNWRYHIDPKGSSINFAGYLDGYLDRMPSAARRLREVSLECMPALDIIAKYGAEPDVLLYVDPPYLGSLRAGNRYRHEMRTDAEHRELAEALRSAAAAVVLSGYPSELYDRELYPDWFRVEIASMTGNGGRDRGRTEALWSNRPLNLHPTLFDLPQKGAA